MGPWDPASSRPEAPPKPARRRPRVWVWVLVAVLFVFACFYLASARFTLRDVTYSDDAVDVEIIEPAAPRAATAGKSNPEP